MDNTNTKGRVKLTTMVNPKLRDRLKIIAIQKRVNFSDLLDKAILQFLKNNE